MSFYFKLRFKKIQFCILFATLINFNSEIELELNSYSQFSSERHTTLKWTLVRFWQAYIRLSEKTDKNRHRGRQTGGQRQQKCAGATASAAVS